jgi:signal transduction histidine kinase
MNDTDKKQEKPDLLRKMCSVASHEIRNPLAIISNSIYFIKTKLNAGGAAVDPKVAKHIGIIEGEVKQSNAVIEQMLAFTHTRELHCAPASLNSAIKDLAGSYLFPPSITLKAIPDPADPCVNADMETIAYALRCILDNSVQAMPEGGTVTIAASSDAGRALLTVTDSGPGLPDGDGEKVFEPFFTTRPRGIGLGLTIARKLLEQQGGTATAQNAAARGARVSLSLPLVTK